MKLDPTVKANFSKTVFKYSPAVLGSPFLSGRISAPTSAGDFLSALYHQNLKACAGSTSKNAVASQNTPSRTLSEINRDTNNDLQGLRPFLFNIGKITAPDNSQRFRHQLQLHGGLSKHNRQVMSLVGG